MTHPLRPPGMDAFWKLLGDVGRELTLALAEVEQPLTRVAVDLAITKALRSVRPRSRTRTWAPLDNPIEYRTACDVLAWYFAPPVRPGVSHGPADPDGAALPEVRATAH